MKKTKRTGYDFKVLWDSVAEARARLQAMTDQEAEAFYHEPTGNGKTGEAIPVTNITPGVTCSACACSSCLLEGCYAVKNAFRGGYKYSPESGRPDGKINATLKNWAENTALVLDRLPVYVKCLRRSLEAFQAAGVQEVRIHGAGDFVTLAYAWEIYKAAKDFPGLRFLAFTKVWEAARLINFDTLANFSLVLSAWPGQEVPEDLRRRYRVSWCQDGTEDRVPADAMHCPGNCDECGLCWYLDDIGRDVWFTKH